MIQLQRSSPLNHFRRFLNFITFHLMSNRKNEHILTFLSFLLFFLTQRLRLSSWYSRNNSGKKTIPQFPHLLRCSNEVSCSNPNVITLLKFLTNSLCNATCMVPRRWITIITADEKAVCLFPLCWKFHQVSPKHQHFSATNGWVKQVFDYISPETVKQRLHSGVHKGHNTKYSHIWNLWIL